MDVILRDDIKGLGYKNDIVSVKPGYGRNYLIPQGLAVIASASNLKMAEENTRQAAHKAEKIKGDAEAIASKLGDLVIEIPAKAGESGKIFGAVTSLQVADVLKEKGFDIDRRKISFNQDIKNLGEYTAEIDLHKEVKHEITIKVIEG
ncbi:50S ribosomal protein L9 [Porifericola rhodea]|uniref:50S ribosomal protein L9 n=1 Tax=Porifericola rhodea TaxID=930972 RepID=UPI00266715A2|nr:50S ribosomal protein L9 [Porifericola rhodea]WKN33978.1 50S ribosomal protein L9 [Porifericola rhodea]